MRAKFLWTIVLALLLSGCFKDAAKPPGGEPSSDPSGSATGTGDPPVGENPPPIDVQNGIQWTDCKAFAATATGPSAVFPYPPKPPGWSEPAIFGINQHRMHAAICERVQWGPFERGPVFTMFELLSGPLAPESCIEGNRDRYSHLATLWISDPELAAYVNRTLNFPVHAGEYELQETPVGETFVGRKWLWGLSGQAKSEISTVDGTFAGPSSYIERMFWANRTHLSYIDLDMRYEITDPDSTMGYGRMESPMVAASSGVHEYTAPTGTQLNSNWKGSVASFSDFACTEPA